MIRAMLITDWFRLLTALTITGVLLYYNTQVTDQIASQLAISDRLSFKYKLVRWLVIFASTSFLGIALTRKRFIETLIIIGGLTLFQILEEFISFL